MDIFKQIENLVDTYINEEMAITDTETIGLDNRAAYRIFINEECIAVKKSQDRILQYYGGFEYVDEEFRKELGDMVFYMNDYDGRIAEHIEAWTEREGV